MPLSQLHNDANFFLQTVSSELRNAETASKLITIIQSHASDDLFIQFNTSREVMRRDVMEMMSNAVQSAQTACASARTSLGET